MSKLEELIAELCPDGVQYIAIKDCIDKIDKIKWAATDGEKYQYIDLTSVDRDTHLIIETQVIDKDNAPSRAQQIVNVGDILLGTTRPMLKRCCIIEGNYDNQVCSTGFCVLRAKTNVVLRRWLYHQISSTAFFEHVKRFQKGASYPAISDADVKSYTIPVPPLPVQSEIVRILDNFTEFTAELTAELTARKKQYEYYRDSLLQKEPNELICVMDICDDVFLGLTNKVDYVSKGGVPLVRANNMTSGTLYLDDVKYISEKQHKKLTKVHKAQKGDILVSKSGTLGAVCIVNTDVEFSIYESLICLHPNNQVYNRYLLHLLKSSSVQNVMLEKKVGNAVKHLNLQTFRKLVVPLPSVEKQKQISDMLDCFDILNNNITTGLHTEIDARKKQYEYYRDKLLTFKELS